MIIFAALLSISLSQANTGPDKYFCRLSGAPDPNYPATLEIRDRDFQNGSNFNTSQVPGAKSFKITPAAPGIKLSYLIEEKTSVEYKCNDRSNGQLEVGYRGLNCETPSPLPGYPSTFAFAEESVLPNEGLPTEIGDGAYFVEAAGAEEPTLTISKVTVSPERDYSCVAGRDPARLQNQLTCSTADISVGFPRSFKLDPEDMPSYYSDFMEVDSKQFISQSLEDNKLTLSQTLDETATYDCQERPGTADSMPTYACTTKKKTPGFPDSFEANELEMSRERPEAISRGDGEFLLSKSGTEAELVRVTPEINYTSTPPADQVLPVAVNINGDTVGDEPGGSSAGGASRSNGAGIR